jgi:ergothioneine biosynthesis protein EgtB
MTAPTQPASAPVAETLLDSYRAVRAATLAFTAPLSPEDLMVQSCPEASPLKWHLAHTSWFFETFILREFSPTASLPVYRPFHPDFLWLFNSYYNAVGDMPAKNLRSSFSRPPLDDILAYRSHVDQAIEQLLEANPPHEALVRITLGLEHEQQHLELAAYDIKNALFTNPLHPAYKPGAPSLDAETWDRATSTPSFTTFHGGLIQVGANPDPADPLAFAFDNETPRHQVFLQPFQLANRLTTVRDYLAFLDDNGYVRPELWLSEAWTTIRTEGWQAPLYWVRDTTAGWKIFTLTGFHPIEALLDTPVCHLSFFEADAFARWSNCRLPTEFEWEHAAASTPPAPRSSQPHRAEQDEHSSTANFLEAGHLHPIPCLSSRSAAEESASPTDSPLHQMFGDVWQWTASPYTGYPGYKPLPGALGEYNGKFMSSQIILRGGSCLTPTTHFRSTYRNFFGPATRWHMCGLRLAR